MPALCGGCTRGGAALLREVYVRAAGRLLYLLRASSICLSSCFVPAPDRHCVRVRALWLLLRRAAHLVVCLHGSRAGRHFFGLLDMLQRMSRAACTARRSSRRAALWDDGLGRA